MTRILVISDIHANLTALEAVIADAGPIDETWCLGDLIGYGPDPNECISMIRELPNLFCMMGNHDLAATGEIELTAFNNNALRSLLWHKNELSQMNLEFLNELPSKTQVIGDVTLVHGSPRDPIWEYIMNPVTAEKNMSFFDTQFCFFGHTHHPACFYWPPGDEEPVHEITKSIVSSEPMVGRAFLNPGSVGQPRDRDPRASYAIYDPQNKTWQAKRVVYDHKQVQERILMTALPPHNANRLGDGT
ncbi:metallophosphoesterase family protein [Chloroflexota bacterium]